MAGLDPAAGKTGAASLTLGDAPAAAKTGAPPLGEKNPSTAAALAADPAPAAETTPGTARSEIPAPTFKHAKSLAISFSSADKALLDQFIKQLPESKASKPESSTAPVATKSEVGILRDVIEAMKGVTPKELARVAASGLTQKEQASLTDGPAEARRRAESIGGTDRIESLFNTAIMRQLFVSDAKPGKVLSEKTLPFDDGEAIAIRDEENQRHIAAGKITLLNQHEQNACGTTALAMLLNYFDGYKPGHAVSAIDDAIRPHRVLDWGTVPRDIVSYAQGQGMRAAVKNDSDLNELTHMLDQNVPCMCLVAFSFANGELTSQPSEATPREATSPHYVVVTGYKMVQNPTTGASEKVFIVANPWGMRQEISAADFDKAWRGDSWLGQNQQVYGIPTGYRRALITMVPDSGPQKAQYANVVLPGSPTGDGTCGAIAQWLSSIFIALDKLLAFVHHIFARDPKAMATLEQALPKNKQTTQLWSQMRSARDPAAQAETLAKLMSLSISAPGAAQAFSDALDKEHFKQSAAPAFTDALVNAIKNAPGPTAQAPH